jgi:hypothetical protein
MEAMGVGCQEHEQPQLKDKMFHNVVLEDDLIE